MNDKRSKPNLEERVARVEGILEEIRTRLNHLEGRFARLENRVEERFARLEDRIARLGDRIEGNFRWTVGIIITMWVTIILTVILK